MRPITVPNIIVPGSTIAIVGEAGGKEETIQGIPFVGNAGRCLNLMLQAAGIDRNKCSILNVVQAAPDGGYDSEHFKETFYEKISEPQFTKTGKRKKKDSVVVRPTDELSAFQLLLQQDIETIHPDVVIATGNEALRFFCGVEGITNYRGSLMESTKIPGLKVIPIVHPSWILRQAQWEYYYITIMDLKKALAESKLPTLNRVQYASLIPEATSYKDAYVAINSIIQSGCDYSLDLEIRAGSIACIGLAYQTESGGYLGCCLPIQTTKGPYWSAVDEASLLQMLDRLLRSNPNLIGQNIWSFDLYWLLKLYGIYPAGVKMDTMIGQFLLAPELPKGLDFIASIHTDAEYYKCLAPETLILKSDLTWSPLCDLKLGDEIIGIDELPQGSKKRRLRRSVITHYGKIKRPCYKITLEDGRSIVSSQEHPWLVCRYAACGSNKVSWIEAQYLKPGMTISQLGKPWAPDNTQEGGWLAGIYDGEGTVGQQMVSFGQNEGLVLEQAKRLLDQKGYSYGLYNVKKRNNKLYQVVSTNMYDSMKLLGSLRPIRLLGKQSTLWEGRKADSLHGKAKIIKVEFVGTKTVVAISTSTKTFIAEGCYTHNSEGKTWGKGAKVSDEQLWAYNIKDCIYTLIASEAITAKLNAEGKMKLYDEYANKLGPYCLEMMYRGLPVDLEKFRYAKDIVLDEHVELRKKVVMAIGDVNVNSPKVMQDVVFNKMGLPERHKRKTGKLTTDEDALMELLLTYPEKAESLRLIMKERHLRKQVSNYVNEKIISEGLLRATVIGPGTKTFRMSMSESPMGEGLNAQTLPKTLRFPYVAPVGRVFLSPDQKQAEARIVAYDAECIRQIEKFQNPKWSIHKELGEHIFGKPPEKDSPQYVASKAGVHGGNFRMGPLKLAKTTGIDVKTCKLAIEGYHSLYPEIRNWHQKQKQLVLSKGQLTNPFGFSRVFYRALAAVVLTGVLPTDEWNDICSWIPQSCPPFITNLAFMALMDRLEYVHLHHQGHDSFLVSVPIEKAQEAAEVALECLRIPMTIKGRTFTIPNDMQIGYSFGQLIPYEGTCLKYSAWEKWCASERAKGKGDSREAIIKGIYGVL